MSVRQTNHAQNYTQWWGPLFWPEGAPWPVRWQTSGQQGQGQILPATFPARKKLSRSKVSAKEQTDRSRLHVMSLSKCKTLLCMLGNSSTQVSKTVNKLQLSCPWKLPGFMQKTKYSTLPGGVALPSVNENCVTWTQKQVTSSGFKTIYIIFSCMTNYVHAT